MKHEHHVIQEPDGALHTVDTYEGETVAEVIRMVLAIAAARMVGVRMVKP